MSVKEKIGKKVGRLKVSDAFATAMKLQKTMIKLQSHLEGICPTGVFRFKTYEEADAWLLRWMTRREARKN